MISFDTYLLFLIILLCLFNLFLIFSVSGFLIRLANSLVLFKKEIEDYYYIKKEDKSSDKQESGLVDL